MPFQAAVRPVVLTERAPPWNWLVSEESVPAPLTTQLVVPPSMSAFVRKFAPATGVLVRVAVGPTGVGVLVGVGPGWVGVLVGVRVGPPPPLATVMPLIFGFSVPVLN